MTKVQFNPDTEIPSLAGKVILVTGGNEGLGKETVLQLSKHEPAKVYLAARSQDKAEKAIAEIKEKAGAKVAPIEFLHLDLSSFDSIKKAVSELKSRTDRLDVVVANAGVIGYSGTTKEGYEWTFGVNHLGTSLLVRLLMPLAQSTASLPDAKKGETRIVILASEAEKHAPKSGYTYEAMKTPLKNLNAMTKYGQSKLANSHFVSQFAKHHPESTTGVKIVAVHPGGVQTNLGSDMMSWAPGVVVKGLRKVLTVAMGLVPVEEGAWNQLWAATATSESSKLGAPKDGGLYWPVAVEGKFSEKVYDEKSAESLWDWTEKELGPHVPQ